MLSAAGGRALLLEDLAFFDEEESAVDEEEDEDEDGTERDSSLVSSLKMGSMVGGRMMVESEEGAHDLAVRSRPDGPAR